MKKVFLSVLAGLVSLNTSADVIYSNNSSDIESQFNYPLKNSTIKIYSGDSYNYQTNKLEFREPKVYTFSEKNYQREIYAKVENKLLSDKLTLTINKDDTGDIKEIESRTIPLADVMLYWGGKFVKFLVTVLPMVFPVSPNEPAYNLSEDEAKLNENQCVKFNDKVSIKVPNDLSIDGKTMEFEGNNGKKCIEVTYKPISNYSIPFNELKAKNVGNNLLSSTCRDVEITVYQTDSKKYHYTTTVVDSNYLTRSPIPKNGILIPEDCNWRIKQ